MKREKDLQERGITLVGGLSERDLFIAGISLYWGEGDKKRRDFKIVNSDPDLIKFVLNWIRKILKINNQRLSASIFINKRHGARLEEVKDYWIRITRIPQEQFTKTILIKSRSKKNYDNFPKHYGTIAIRVKNPAPLHGLILGLIEGLKKGGLEKEKIFK
ncbi:MAG: hypothetical protein PHW72_02705 [Candidatus Pacebacteria bacterium]|nr:hypothetical protein [Candidatus Paceibacterota bacterium]